MAIYRAYGNQLVDNQSAMEMGFSGQLQSFETTASTTETAFEFAGEPVPFEPIGLGRPLTVEIRHVYTGNFPRSVLGFNDGMLVSSAVKSIATFDAAPRAVNFLRAKSKSHTNMRNPAATEEGTPLVFYSPALTETSSLITFELTFDEFPKPLVDGIASAFKSAAGIPVFAPYSAYMVAAGTIVGLIGRLGEKLVDGRPAFTVTEPLGYLRPGDNAPQEGFHLLAQDNFDIAASGCEFDATQGQLVDKETRQPYDGPHPYVVISLDGRKNDQYADFLPTAASAALLGQFFHVGENQEQSLDILINSLKLYNDLGFRKRADRLADSVAQTLEDKGEDSEEYKKVKAQYDAFVANILNDELKP
ncbi:MAG: hypothetical protein ACK2UO_10345 [Caldilineaceae bacterium]